MTTINTAIQSPLSRAALIDSPASTYKTVEIKQAVKADLINQSINGQVLPPMAQARSIIEGASPRELQAYLDTSAFTETDSQAMMNVFLAAVAVEERRDPKGVQADPVSALLNFDPNAWEKHVGVLIAAIIAVNLARQASAEMSGKFAVIAFESAKAQGVAIIKGGEAAMYAAITGAAVTGAMTLVGAGMQLKGQAQRHMDISLNKRGAMNLDIQAQRQRDVLKSFPTQRQVGGDSRIQVRNSRGDLETRQAHKGNGLPTQDERTKLEITINNAVNEAKSKRMASLENQKAIDRNLTVGAAISSMGMALSAGVSSVVRLMEFAERNNEVMRQAQNNIEKSVAEMANQNVGENTALIAKLLEAFQQMIDGRNATNNAIASSRA